MKGYAGELFMVCLGGIAVCVLKISSFVGAVCAAGVGVSLGAPPHSVSGHTKSPKKTVCVRLSVPCTHPAHTTTTRCWGSRHPLNPFSVLMLKSPKKIADMQMPLARGCGQFRAAWGRR